MDGSYARLLAASSFDGKQLVRHAALACVPLAIPLPLQVDIDHTHETNALAHQTRNSNPHLKPRDAVRLNVRASCRPPHIPAWSSIVRQEKSADDLNGSDTRSSDVAPSSIPPAEPVWTQVEQNEEERKFPAQPEATEEAAEASPARRRMLLAECCLPFV